MVPTADRPSSGALSSVLRRLIIGLVTLWTAVTFAFFALRLAAGDPTQGLVSQGLATAEQAQALRASLGFADPLLVQYARFLGGVAHGDLGRSIYTQRPVRSVIAEQAAPTAELALAGLGLTALLGFTLGVVGGLRPARRSGRVTLALSNFSTAVPISLTAILILWLALQATRAAPFLLPLTRSNSLLLPALALGVASAGALARVIQSGLEDNLQAPFLLAARARGVGQGQLAWHALRPVLPLAISFLALEAALLLGGTVVTETVFARPGLGRLLISSILSGDYPVVQGLVLVGALVYTVTHAMADVISAFADPRLRDAP
jgi:peptide/nickel transport system permease protein